MVKEKEKRATIENKNVGYVTVFAITQTFSMQLLQKLKTVAIIINKQLLSKGKPQYLLTLLKRYNFGPFSSVTTYNDSYF